ncbi:MAG: peptide ABC transporter substrate-binding protein [Cypionkella sp.]
MGSKGGLLAALVALTLGCGSPVWADDTLDRGIGSEWSSLDPHVNFDAAAGWIQMDAYEGLVTYDATGRILPGAAEKWDISADGLTYTFHLRHGLKWSNGDKLVAQDFVNGVLRTLNPETASEKGYYFYSVIQVKGAKELSDGTTKDPATLGVTAPDDQTVLFQLLAPSPDMLEIMGAFQMAPLHKPSFDQYGAGVFIDPAHMVSNGAYVIAEVVPQSHVLLAKNPNYWDAANVHIHFVKYHVTEDVATELKRYQAGELDITYDIPLNQIADLKVKMPDEVKISPSTEEIYYSFNLTHEAFKNPDLRRALSLAIDRDTLENKIVKGEAIPVMSFAGGFDPDYHGPQMAEATMSQADREALAKELYAKAGFGPDKPLKINIVATISEDAKRRAQGVALMWKKVLGVHADVQPMERKAWLDAFYAGSWDVFSDDLVGDFAGPETFLAYMRPSAEPGYNWVKPEYDAAMDVAAKLADRPARYEALAKAEKILLDDTIFAPISIVPNRHMVKTTVHGWGASAASYNNSQFMTLD